MPRIYHLSKTGTRLLYKIRHHKGHGIHSPFVFNLITKVIEEKAPYYAYYDIDHFLEKMDTLSFSENKINRLSFKLINHFNAKQIMELGAGEGYNTLYLTAAASDINCLSVEIDEKKRKKAQLLYNEWNKNIVLTENEFPEASKKPDCIFINLRNYQPDPNALILHLLSIVKENTFIIIDGIRINRKQQALWKRLIVYDNVTISLDLFHVGILFFDPKYFKRNYKLSF